MHHLSLIRKPQRKPLLLIGLALLCLGMPGSSPKLKKLSQPEGPLLRWKPRHIQYGFTLQNASDRTLDRIDLWTLAPVDQAGAQRCEALSASCPYTIETDGLGNRRLHFVFHDVPPHAAKIVTLRASLLLSESPPPANRVDVEGFLGPERFIESSDPLIRGLAGGLRADSPAETAHGIFHWVAANIRYAGYLPRVRGALHAVKHRKGDCSEFAAAFTACCRASGIPARVVGGFVCTEDSILEASDYHNWAEFHLDGRWWIADPQRRVFRGDPAHHIVMQVMGEAAADPLGSQWHWVRIKGEGAIVGK